MLNRDRCLAVFGIAVFAYIFWATNLYFRDRNQQFQIKYYRETGYLPCEDEIAQKIYAQNRMAHLMLAMFNSGYFKNNQEFNEFIDKAELEFKKEQWQSPINVYTDWMRGIDRPSYKDQ